MRALKEFYTKNYGNLAKFCNWDVVVHRSLSHTTCVETKKCERLAQTFPIQDACGIVRSNFIKLTPLVICDLQYFPLNSSSFPSMAVTCLHCWKAPIQKKFHLRTPAGGLPIESTTESFEIFISKSIEKQCVPFTDD